jgi:hypothetical protein
MTDQPNFWSVKEDITATVVRSGWMIERSQQMKAPWEEPPFWALINEQAVALFGKRRR